MPAPGSCFSSMADEGAEPSSPAFFMESTQGRTPSFALALSGLTGLSVLLDEGAEPLSACFLVESTQGRTPSFAWHFLVSPHNHVTYASWCLPLRLRWHFLVRHGCQPCFYPFVSQGIRWLIRIIWWQIDIDDRAWVFGFLVGWLMIGSRAAIRYLAASLSAHANGWISAWSRA